MTFILIAAAVFLISSWILYATTNKNYLGKDAKEKGVTPTQYYRVLFAISIFFTVVVLLVIKAIRG